ncbi:MULTISPECIES: Zn-ribbon domain-containing OB-fold protein [Nocardia]|uniref:Zn-ribbon domain-containing OB-fold protein n=1 Tax=Nocardia TaxID=1817 RepID=UPI000D688ABD|nr:MULTISPECIES: OB-fold domain-containing protein [Nocardia]
MSKQVPLADGLFTWPAEKPVLIAGKCEKCGFVDFPRKEHCLRCFTGGTQRYELPRRGKLWTFTTQRFRPPAPPYAGADTAATFEPFNVGYIDLGGEILVEARLTEPDHQNLTIGQEMELVVVPFGIGDDDTETMIYAFRPVG